MLFSSNIFLFIFLPFVVLIYYVVLRNYRLLQNIFLLLSSLFFYAWGEPKFVLVMTLSITLNWLAGVLINYFKERSSIDRAKCTLIFSITFNLIIIFIFKYLNFTVNNINNLLSVDIKVPNIALPIGISFFTFQAISYVIDVYRGSGKAQKSILNVGLYISFFPQLIAGPIVRYETIAEQIVNRRENLDDFCSGIRRFIIGFCKKILLANNLAFVADNAFKLSNENSISVGMAWIGAVAYTLQIFYDFSGYSDMAIGLGKMFGFHFLENFNCPYISKSITEFWRRWHISLGTWFRDYLYIPLGGSRVDKKRAVVNLLIVWLCTGIWHGANWTFIIWGLMYFVLLVFERNTDFQKNLNGASDHIKRAYTMFFVVLGWIMFRADNITSAVEYYKDCVGINGNSFIDDSFLEYAGQYLVYFVAGIIMATPISKWINRQVRDSKITGTLYAIGLSLLFVISISFMVKGSYNPFIYFNF